MHPQLSTRRHNHCIFQIRDVRWSRNPATDDKANFDILQADATERLAESCWQRHVDYAVLQVA